MKHYPVLLQESIDGLQIKCDGIYVDATLGRGGHSSEILKQLTTGWLYSFDEDETAIKESRERLEQISDHFTLIHANFSEMKDKLSELGVTQVDGILFDLGLSSPQIDDASRGFSFMQEARLDMRMDQSKDFSAYEVVNNYSVDELKRIFYLYGEEDRSSFIAKGIVQNRPITTTTELVNVIQKSVGQKYFYLKHPERQIFQAIRIEVNHELSVLESVLPDAIQLLKVGGRCSVITFHSLEDRIVKQTFKTYSEVPEFMSGLPLKDIPEEYRPKIKLMNKKPILASDKELKENTRSKSAKLRIIERI